MNPYVVESWAGWFVTLARNKRHAKSEGVNEFGRGMVQSVRKASIEEAKHYADLRGGPRALEPDSP